MVKEKKEGKEFMKKKKVVNRFVSDKQRFVGDKHGFIGDEQGFVSNKHGKKEEGVVKEKNKG